MTEPDFESRLRASLRRHAHDAPPADPVAERVLRETGGAGGDAAPPRRPREWRTWTLPLAAAAAVIVVAGMVVGLTQIGHSPSPAATQLAGPTSVGSTAATAPTASPTTAANSPASPGATEPAVPADLHDVHVLDATFVNPDDGWLLARADCIDSAGTCTAMLRTTDGGAHWTSMPNPPVNVPGVDGCTTPCVDHIRFARADVGYAYGDGYYGSSAFFMTTDGGRSWQQQKGVTVVALETLANNVIRVSATPPGCGPPGCGYAVETSAIGSTTWTTHPLPAPATEATGVVLARGGQDAYLLVTGHTAGGAQDARSTLYRSSDDGASWTDAGEPCPQPGGETDSVSLAAGAGGRVSVTCVTRQAPQTAFVAVSTDQGAHFTRVGAIPWTSAGVLVGDPATVLLAGPASGSGQVYRSTDGGTTWTPVAGLRGAGTLTWAGFESKTVGRVIADGGRAIWTTRDAGATWTRLTFG